MHLEQDLRKAWHKQWYQCILNNDLNTAAIIDFKFYNQFVKANESVENWDWWYSNTYSLRQELTAKYTEKYPDRELINYKKENIGFVFHNYSGLAHETQLARAITTLRDKYEFAANVIYMFGDEIAEKPETIHKTKNIYFLKASSYIDGARKLDELTFSQQIGSVIYPSIYWFAYWASLVNRHPNQKFLQMKYYPLQVGRIKRWAGGLRSMGEKFYQINGEKYEQLPVLDLLPSKTLFKKQENHSYGVIGSISRIEKIKDENYNRMIQDILSRCPSAKYIYTGRAGDESKIPSYISTHERALFWGWVKPEDKIADIDIYIEPFPWGGGDMTFLALSAGLPYLILKTKESELFGLYSFVKLISEENSELSKITEYSFCNTIEEMRDKCIKLLSDKSFAKDLGQAWQKTVSAIDMSKKHNDWMDFLLN